MTCPNCTDLEKRLKETQDSCWDNHMVIGTERLRAQAERADSAEVMNIILEQALHELSSAAVHAVAFHQWPGDPKWEAGTQLALAVEKFRHLSKLGLQKVPCPDCKKDMVLQEFYDKKAWQCSDCIFHRITLDGKLEFCHMHMETGALTWHERKAK